MRNRYCVPSARPVRPALKLPPPRSFTAGVMVAYAPPAVDCSSRYPVMALPPVSAGACQETVVERMAESIALTAAGGSGVPSGVTEFETADSALSPAPLVACTVNVYDVPLVSPVTVTGLELPEPVFAPGVEVTVYETMASPPVETGAVKLTVACERSV